MSLKGKADFIIEDVAGCGLFQAILVIVVVSIGKIVIAFTMMFMSFGNYNPGWRCLDNGTHSTSNITKQNYSDSKYTEGSCDDHKRCQNVEFDPETSTLVTEWGLLCEKEWINSMIISLQMSGMLIGSLVGGQLADLVGRKKIFYSSCALCAILHLISSFTVSWAMSVVIRCFLGIFSACVLVILYTFISEFMTARWRGVLMSIPLWIIGATVDALVTMRLKDWRLLEQVNCGLYVILFIPVIWIPESLRWLEVKGKTKEFARVARKIVKCNNKTLPSFDETRTSQDSYGVKKYKYTIIDMFRPGFKLKTVSVVLSYFSFSLIYYALSFGVRSFYGNFYINLIIFPAIAMPILLLSSVGLRYCKRKTANLITLGISFTCSFGIVACIFSTSEEAKAIGSNVLIAISKGTIEAAWLILYVRVTEMYPTVIRSTALGLANVSAGVGGILAPFAIPSGNSHLHIFIIVSAVVLLFCLFFSYKLPETKGKQLKETFGDATELELHIAPTNVSNRQET